MVSNFKVPCSVFKSTLLKIGSEIFLLAIWLTNCSPWEKFSCVQITFIEFKLFFIYQPYGKSQKFQGIYSFDIMENYKIIRRNQFACSTMQVRRDRKMPVALLHRPDLMRLRVHPPKALAYHRKRVH